MGNKDRPEEKGSAFIRWIPGTGTFCRMIRVILDPGNLGQEMFCP
jgi:hypothetical protein